MWVTDMIRKVVNLLFSKDTIEKELKTTVVVSTQMQKAIQLWNSMYVDLPPWKSDTCKTMNLPASIAHEFARLITVEHEVEISGSPMADYLNEQYHLALGNFMEVVEKYCAKGGVCLKPYVQDNSIEIDVTQAERFFPITYDGKGKITKAIFIDQIRKEQYVYTRLEIHEMKKNAVVQLESGEERITNTYIVENRAYKSEQQFNYREGMDPLYCKEPFKNRVPLTEVDEWASITPNVTINDIEQPLFVYIKVPAANNVDPQSPLGASVYSRAVQAIQDCDEQYTQSKFEFEALEAAIDADADMFKKDRDGNPILPAGKERQFRSYNIRSKDQRPFLEAFAPAIRDNSLFNGLDHYLKVVEMNVELSYGTFSDPQSVEKTAEEVKTSKQRSFSAVSNMQGAWDEGIRDLVYAMYVYAILYGLTPIGTYDVSINWGDGILEDINIEFQRRWQMVLGGKLKPEKFMAWYFGCSEEEALEMMPPAMEMPMEE